MIINLPQKLVIGCKPSSSFPIICKRLCPKPILLSFKKSVFEESGPRKLISLRAKPNLSVLIGELELMNKKPHISLIELL